MADQPDESFEQARRDARRAQLAMNALVILSAIAGAAFFGFVLFTIKPFGERVPEPVQIPTSQSSGTMSIVEGDTGGLRAELRDLDPAPGYSGELSARLAADLGIGQSGRLYRLALRNGRDAPVEVSLGGFSLTGKDGTTWSAQWIGSVADAEKASAMGRLRLSQAASGVTLPPGGEYQLDVFIAGEPPAADGFTAGRVELGSAVVHLAHQEVSAAR